MSTPTPEAIGYTPTAHNLMEAWEVPGKRLREAETQTTSAIERRRDAQRAVAKIKAEALTEAAEVYGAGEWVDGFLHVHDDVSAVQATVKWLRARAATIEGKDS